MWHTNSHNSGEKNSRGASDNGIPSERQATSNDSSRIRRPFDKITVTDQDEENKPIAVTAVRGKLRVNKNNWKQTISTIF